MTSFTCIILLSANEISGISPIPNPEKANQDLSQSECFKVTKGPNYLLIDYRGLALMGTINPPLTTRFFLTRPEIIVMVTSFCSCSTRG